MVGARRVRMLKIVNVTEEGYFGVLQRWIPAVSGRLKDFGFDQCNPSCLNSDRFYKELNQQSIGTRRLVLHRLTKEVTYLIKPILLFIPEQFHLALDKRS